ncbi:hypothetical protein [Streptomyces sp. NBC_01006]|uniref:hypothetical protein n=1 Tax=Streptomyces sp. NBC_01006 TaxID=2903716 RepID=UPI0038636B24|nr:hypothetical protein OG509_31205 [Streptomyces sp. NBC_01006]
MSQTGHERPGQPGQSAQHAQHAHHAELEQLEQPTLDRLLQPAEPAQDVPRRSDPRELLTDGVVELRKRGELAARRPGAGAEDHLETMARRAAERVASEGHPRA